MKRIISMSLAAAALVAAGCTPHVAIEPIEFKPITINVNLRMVDKELDDVLAVEKQYQEKNTTAPSPQPPAPTNDSNH